MTLNKKNDILDDIQNIMKHAVVIVPRIYTFLAPLNFEKEKPDVFHLQRSDVEYMIDKAEELAAKYRNIYIVPETHPLFAYYAGLKASTEEEEDTVFECNAFYLVFDAESRQYLP